MKKSLTALMRLSVAAGLAAICSAGAAESSRWHVNASAQSPQDGLGWKTAYSSLQSALEKAKDGDEIWVAGGTYTPHATDRTVSFQLKKNVSVYGGFAGTETDLAQRDFRKNPTVLSGNIGRGDKTKNTATILKGADGAVLDGFTVSDAYATDKPRMHLLPSDIQKNDMEVGGGMRNFKVSPVVRNCIFKNNFSPKGGAVYNVQDAHASQAQFINVEFTGNTAQIRGGAVSNDLGAMPIFINCRFTGNRCGDKGGAVYNDFAASPVLLNCLIQSNGAVSAGGIGNDGGSSPLLVNVTITDNEASAGFGGGLYQGTGANNNTILINSKTDNIYNWHEDIVAVLNSSAPAEHSIPLADFIPISTLKGSLTSSDLRELPSTGQGYQENLDGAALLKQPLVAKLLAIYRTSGGVIGYRGEYIRPAAGKDAASAVPAVVYAAESGSGTGDGSSWENAMTGLQQAIDRAAAGQSAVWIKAGTYAPSAKTARIAAFILYDGVKLYGGFAGTEKKLSDRVPGAATILSAKVKGGTYAYPHVLYGADNVVLEGLTIRDGKADGFTYNGKGGGLLAYRAGKTYAPLGNYPATGFVMRIDNCRFIDNQALEGGAIYAFSKGKLTITGTTFENNRALYGGAVLSREGNTFTYEKCVFQSNQALIDGGATYEDYGAHADFRNCTFIGNTAKAHGGAVYVISRASQLEATAVKVEECSFARNQASEGDDLFCLDDSKVTLTKSNADLYRCMENYKQAGGSVRYRYLGEYSLERLNKILTSELAEFSSCPVKYPAAENAVKLYKVLYMSSVPEENNRPVKVSGLIAVPEVAAKRQNIVSYQHGTVFSRDEVPSCIENSAETRLAVAQFAGRGSVVIAPDYIGKGTSGEPDGWMVRETTAQACVDMLSAARSVLADLGIVPGELFLSGWSQGSFSTLAFLKRLEENGVPVRAAAVASSPNDIYLCVNRWIHVPSSLDVDWLVGAAALLINSYEHYYKLPGLSSEAVKPEYLQAARDLYFNRISWTDAQKKLPSTVKELFQEEFIMRLSTGTSRFAVQMLENSSYRWRFKTPVFYYYGAQDEVVTPYMVRLPVEYQKTLGAAPATAVSAGENADHRGTFVFGLSDQKKRFGELLSGGK